MSYAVLHCASFQDYEVSGKFEVNDPRYEQINQQEIDSHLRIYLLYLLYLLMIYISMLVF